MIDIREATEDDNNALNELQKKCPMGTSFILGVDSAPDYFARSKPFENWHVFVATEKGVIVGSAACAISDTYVEGKRLKTAYEYGFIVDPFHRRKGVAEKLQRRIEHAALDNDVDLLHLDITQDNFPSISFFSKMGFQKVKDCATLSLMPYEKQKASEETHIRSMEKADVDDVVNLINDMYRDYNFFTPFQSKSLLAYLERMPHFDFHNILVLEENDEVKACLGYWDYNKIRKYIVQKLSWKLKAQTNMIKLIGLITKMPHVPKQGEPLLSYNLTIIAFKNPESMMELIKTVINIALENKINFIHVAIDPNNPTAAVLSQFRHTEIKLHFFIKSLRQERLPNPRERKIYIDATEM
jgi:GNAT superfamily N-acetyltransferase